MGPAEVTQVTRGASRRPWHASANRRSISAALWLAAGKIAEVEMMTYRSFGSRLEGHPTVAFPYTEAATGSLGQGLSIGLGMALNGKYLDKLPYMAYVLLGDSEMSEGSQWEAVELAAYYKLDNLIGIEARIDHHAIGTILQVRNVGVLRKHL
mgnify:CR=1 FL=1